jgi:uncharacterized membrane protein YphA (DoxX/SURF4 family)
MDKLFMIARLLLGLAFVVFGLNGFFNFLPVPPMPDRAMGFMGALMATGYMMPMVKGLEVLCGLLFLFNRFTALAVLLIAPNVVNIFLFHFFLAPEGLIVAIAILALTLITAWAHRSAYRAVLQP